MASRDITLCDERLQNVWKAALIKWAEKSPTITPFITCTYRSPEEQNALYAQGRTTEGHVVTNAKEYESAHNFTPCQAFDIAFKDSSNKLYWDKSFFESFAEIVKSLDETIVWGGEWTTIHDAPHFETSHWRDIVPYA